VLALIGENGAGKSTLLKVLSGAHRADQGELRLQGQPYCPSGNPHQARKAGVAMIYQELSLAPDLSVEDNILLGQPCLPGGILWRSGQRAQVREVLAAVGLSELSPQAMVGGQSVATQQLIEIARALASQARIILFDEPTSSLPQADVRRLFSIIDKLKSQGLGIVYISHFLEEVREVADRYCVLRDGQQVGQGELKGVSDAQIISLMVGRDVRELYPKVPHEIGEVVVDVRHLSG
jgi:ribose transport system ATP-binding protein